jgi:hypothetical protein
MTILLALRVGSLLSVAVAAAAQPILLPSCPVYNGIPQLSAACVAGLGDVAFDSNGVGWVADRYRVMRVPDFVYNRPLPTMFRADVVIGKPDFMTSTISGMRDCQDCAIGTPDQIAFDLQGNLWVTETTPQVQHVLRFPAPFRTFEMADLVLGFSAKGGIAFDGSGNLWLAESDTGCDRVMMFAPPFSPGMVPQIVLGQPSYGTCLAPSPGANRLASIRGLAIDKQGTLYVGDNGGNRIAIFRPPLSNFVVPSAVIGQNDLSSYSPIAFEAGGLTGIYGLAIGSTGELWVLHNYGTLLSAYAPPFQTGQGRTFWSDLVGQQQSEGKLPYRIGGGPDSGTELQRRSSFLHNRRDAGCRRRHGWEDRCT